jgi:hypothetical protein
MIWSQIFTSSFISSMVLLVISRTTKSQFHLFLRPKTLAMNNLTFFRQGKHLLWNPHVLYFRSSVGFALQYCAHRLHICEDMTIIQFFIPKTLLFAPSSIISSMPSLQSQKWISYLLNNRLLIPHFLVFPPPILRSFVDFISGTCGSYY